jgi:hypothetical protein
MRTFSEKLNEMKYGQPLIDQKEQMKNLLVAAAGNDQRVLNDIVECMTEDQMRKCFDKLSKVYGYTGEYGQIVRTNPI